MRRDRAAKRPQVFAQMHTLPGLLCSPIATQGRSDRTDVSPKVKLLPPPHCPGNIDPLGQYLVVEEQLRRTLLRRHNLITHRQHR